jgi:hypothetical protein
MAVNSLEKESKPFPLTWKSSSFLRPLYKELTSHYPANEDAKRFIHHDFPFSLFIKSSTTSGYDAQFHSESHPWEFIQCKKGYIQTQHSCLCPKDSLSISLKSEKMKNGLIFPMHIVVLK